MPAALIRTRGQAAIFAGCLLGLFLPFFRIGALTATGYDSAAALSASTKNYSPLLQWTSHHLGLAIVFTVLQIIPVASILALPLTLRRVVFGEGGSASQWFGLVGLATLMIFAVLDLALLLAAAHSYASAGAATRGIIGANFRITAIGEGLIANILAGAALCIWLVMLDIPLARLDGLERIIGFIGVAVAGIFGASALLEIYDPQQPQGAFVGTAHGALGLWLILIGALLVQRASRLGSEVVTESAE